MPARDKNRSPKKKVSHKPANPTPLEDRDEQAEEATDAKTREAEEHFVRGVVDRGEAAKPVDGELPPGATHEIVEEKEGELPKIKRKRFSMF
jgi:hypothetical protein